MGFLSGKVIQYIIISYNFEDFQSILKFSVIFFAGGCGMKKFACRKRGSVLLSGYVRKSVVLTNFCSKTGHFFYVSVIFTNFRGENCLFWIFTNRSKRGIIPHTMKPLRVHPCTAERRSSRSVNLMAPTRGVGLFLRAFFSCTFFQKRLDRGARMWYNTPAMKQNVPRSHLGGKGGRVDRFRDFTVFRAGRGFARFFVFSA